MASLTVDDGVTFSLGHNLAATTVTVGSGAGTGVINQSAGTLTATTLIIGAADSFTQSGTGTLAATNTTIATGGTLTVVNQGTGTIQGAGAGQGALVFAGNYNTDSVLGGTTLASITVNNGVTLTLDQAASTAGAFTVGTGASGVVTHSAGTLTAATLVIASGATFTQSGGAITAATTIQDGGTLNVSANFTHTGALTVGSGASGTLDVAGSTVTATTTFTMAAGSTLKTTINTDTANDAGTITATGAVSINAGTTIDITVTPGSLTTGQTYVIVTGGSGVSTVPTTITDNSATYTFTGSTTGTTLTLTVGVASGIYSSSVTSSSNSSAAAKVFDAIAVAGATGDMSTVLTQLNTLSGTALDTAITTTIPDVSGAVISTGLSAQAQSLGVVTSRLAALRNGDAGTDSGVSSGSAATNTAIWGQAFGSTAEQDRRADTDGYDSDTVGLAFGGDKILDSKDWIVGGAYSYSVSNVNYKASRSGNGSDIDSHQGTLYGSLDEGPYYIDILGSVARNGYNTERKISVGSIQRTAKGDFKALQYSAKVGGGYNIPMGGGWTVTPTASLQATHLAIDGYTETGANALNLQVASEKYNQLQSGLGVAGSYVMQTAGGRSLSTTLHATWLYDLKSARQNMTSSYTGGGGAFATDGPAPAVAAANLGAAMNYSLDGGLSIAATYDAEIKDQYLSHSATATARLEF